MKPNMPVVKRVVRPLVRLACDRRGATAIEYGLILALVFLAMLMGLYSLGKGTGDMWDYVNVRVTNAH
jgi:pilus assembly protein Flp/PilA